MDTEPPQDCDRCPRLVGFRSSNRAREPGWHNSPVQSFGSANCQVLIVGLAPGLTGANRTGRPFTGDHAGHLLYATLLKFGFARGEYGGEPTDGLSLVNCMISNAVRCVPPQNKPTPLEIRSCNPFLANQIASLSQLQVMIALGRVAHDGVLTALGLRKSSHPFAHGAQHRLDVRAQHRLDVRAQHQLHDRAQHRLPHHALTLVDSYHCSRYNTNTGVLTPAMFEAVFDTARRVIEAAPNPSPNQ